jgi:hypothetical protein
MFNAKFAGLLIAGLAGRSDLDGIERRPHLLFRRPASFRSASSREDRHFRAAQAGALVDLAFWLCLK